MEGSCPSPMIDVCGRSDPRDTHINHSCLESLDHRCFDKDYLNLSSNYFNLSCEELADSSPFSSSACNKTSVSSGRCVPISLCDHIPDDTMHVIPATHTPMHVDEFRSVLNAAMSISDVLTRHWFPPLDMYPI
eukprot:10347218-Karenia_brevis.AAC.1